MANLLDRASAPRSVASGRGPQSGVDYFGNVGQGRNVRTASADRGGERPSAPEPGVDSLTMQDSVPAGVGQREIAAPVAPTEANSKQSIQGLRPGVSPIASPRAVATAMQVAGLAAPPLGFIGSLISAADKDSQSMAKDETRDLSGFTRTPLGMLGVNPIGAEAMLSAADAARRYNDDDPGNDPSLRTYAPALTKAMLSAYMPDSLKPAMTAASLAQQLPGDPATPQGIAVTTKPAAEQAAQAAQAAAEEQARNAAPPPPPAPGIPVSDPFSTDDPNTQAMMDSISQFENSNRGRGDIGAGGGINNSAGSGDGSDSGTGSHYAADGGMAGPQGFSRPGLPGPGQRPQMPGGPGGMRMGNAPPQESVQATVQRTLRDPAAVQRLIARPMALMQSGELTPDEVLTLGRVAEAAMYNPQLYPQLRAFVAEQGMTPLPPSFDPSVITNIMVISKALQAQMPATPAGQVPPTDQAMVEQPVPGFGNGGFIRGPGTGRSDSIGTMNESSGAPVKVATDEYIIPAHVVRAKGREFFDNLLQRYAPGGAAQ